MELPDAHRLYILTTLREARGLTLADMAERCGLHSRRGRESVGRWEQGLSIPHAKRRPKILEYLREGLALTPQEVEDVWQIFVDVWGWDALSADEVRTLASTAAAEVGQAEPDPAAFPSGSANSSQTTGFPTGSLPEPGPLPRGSKMPLGRNPLFVGRRADLVALADALNANGAAAIGQIDTAAATGLGGIGKTQLACEFVHRYGRFFEGGVFWLSFEDERSIPAAIASCGDAGALELRADFALRSLDDQVRLVQAAWQEPLARLLIFDNCEAPELIARWRPKTGGCRVLVTSRRGEWDAALGVGSVALGVLERSESLDLLRRLCDVTDIDALDAIAEELGDLPLALHLAGSYLHRYRRVMEAGAYLQQLRDPDLLQHPSMQAGGISPTNHAQHVGRTFALSYDKLDLGNRVDAIAHTLLVHAAHFAPGEPIWYNLLVKTLGPAGEDGDGLAHQLTVDEAFSRLVELGLIETVEDKILRMHRLVAAFVRDVAQDQVTVTQKAVEEVVFEETARVNREGRPLPLLAWQLHLRSVADVATAREDAEGARLCMELGEHLTQIGNFAGAQPYLEKALAIRRKLHGEDHVDTAASYSALGSNRRFQADLPGALPYFERALAIRERLLGDEDLAVAETLNDLGWALTVDRQCDAGRRRHERAFCIAHKRLGDAHRLTADYANNLGLCLQDCFGDSEAALPYMLLALETRRSALGEMHPLTALSHNNVGWVMQAQGRLDEALSHYEQAVKIREAVLGHDHPDVAQSLLNLGRTCQAKGELDEAKRHLQRAVAIYIRALGEEHFRAAFGLHALGALCLARGDLDEAQDYLARALAVRREVYSADNPNLAVTLYALGELMVARGNAGAASAYFAEALAIRCRALGAEHADTAATQRALAAVSSA